MSKSMIYIVNANTQTVPDGGIINIGTVIRRFGCNCALSGNGVVIDGAGYYKVSVNATAVPAAASTITLAAYKDGAAITGITASETVAATDTSVQLCAAGVVRIPCCATAGTITFVASGGDSDFTNIAVVVEKV